MWPRNSEAGLYRAIDTFEVLVVAGDGYNGILCGYGSDAAKGLLPTCFQRTVYEIAPENKKVGCGVMSHNVGHDIVGDAVDGILYVSEIYELGGIVAGRIVYGEAHPLRRVGFQADAVVVDARLRGVEAGVIESRCPAL